MIDDNEHPQAGGSYVREKATGELRKVEGTEPAAGRDSAPSEQPTGGAARRKPTKES